MAQTKKKAFKATPATKRRSKGDLVKTIAAGTDLQAAKVKDVLKALTATMAADLGQEGLRRIQFQRTDDVEDGEEAGDQGAAGA